MSAPFTLAPLPWDEKALEPVISAKTIDFHYHKHHQTYVDTLNKLVDGTPYAALKLEEIVRKTAGASEAKDKQIFNNAAQVWNHTFFWNSMKPAGGGKPSGKLAAKIDADFGSYDAFRAEFIAAAMGQFGSGWAWLVLDGGKLKVTKTSNADLPMKAGQTALLTTDVWEHAYYIDYRNLRQKWVEAFLDHLVNWDFASANLG